jgi:hypothetical protein
MVGFCRQPSPAVTALAMTARQNKADTRRFRGACRPVQPPSARGF